VAEAPDSLRSQLAALRGVPVGDLPPALVDVRVQQVGDLRVLRPRDWEQLRHEEGGAGRGVPYWAMPWPSGRVLAETVVADPPAPGTRVLELGCGLGLPAIVAATRGARVVASDWHRAPLAFVRRSARLNHCRVELVQMDWAAPAVRGPFDLCLGADVAYDAGAEAALVAALCELVAPAGQVWLADSVNTARHTLVERLRAQGFSIAVRQVREWEDERPVWVRVIEGRRQ